MPKSTQTPADPVSKSQLKRDMIALQKMGQSLIELSDTQLAKIPLPDTLLDAIILARSLKSHESIRRHLQYIGKLMRKVDHEPIEKALQQIKHAHQVVTKQFHQAEEWREKLIVEGDTAVQGFIDLFPAAERQKLRQLVRKSQQDRKHEKDTGGEKELFRYIRNFISN